MGNIPTFNLTGLAAIYVEAEQRYEKYTAFQIEIGKGCYLCMMFLSDEDDINKDMLFIYLRNLNRFLHIKTYGNHHNGDFKIYLSEEEKRLLMDELLLVRRGGSFSFEQFINEFNQKIPQTISRNDASRLLRLNKSRIPSGVIDDMDKTVLVSIKRLPPDQHPQDKTLRKLYLFTNADTDSITLLIKRLKESNCTVCWTTEENRNQAKEISELLTRMN